MQLDKAKLKPKANTVVKQLDALADRRPDLMGPIAYYRAACPLLYEAQGEVDPFVLPPDVAERKLELGLPILVNEDLPFDVEAGQRLMVRLCRVVEANSNQPDEQMPSWLFRRNSSEAVALQTSNRIGLRAAAKQLRQAIEKDQLDFTPMWLAVAAGDEPQLEVFASSHHLEPQLLQSLGFDCLKPSLRVWAQTFIQVGPGEWRRGECPVCGNSPLLAEIQGKDGERRLRCGACGADWHYPRLQCAFCANTDYKTLGYLTVDGEEEKYHLQTCDQCRRYLKIIATFDLTPTELLIVKDLATLHLDLIAMQAGFIQKNR